MHVTMLLADAAQVADGKLYILGGGWSMVGPAPAPMAVAAKLSIDSHELGREMHWELFLEDADGHPVLLDTPQGPMPLEVRGELRAEPLPGLRAGTPVDLPLVINFGPFPLTPDARYVWRLVVDGEHHPGAAVSFTTRPATSPS